MAITSFVLGMRLGKKQAELFLQSDGGKVVTALELKSSHEEELGSMPTTDLANQKLTEEDVFTDQAVSNNETSDMDEETFKKLQSEYQKLNAQELEASSLDSEEADQLSLSSKPQTAPDLPINETTGFLNPDPSFIGKYTIQLGSYRTLDEAKNFAQGFLVRGYKPLVREVEVRGQGVWYRVSLGVFESISAATQYIQKESVLFGGYKKDQYFIQEIK